MNDGLDFYENETRVISIHGYIYPIKKELPKTFFLKGADCWGWATWKRGWDVFNKDGKALLQEIYQRNLAHEFDFDGAYKYTQMLQDQIDGKNNSWAVRWLASAFLADKLTLYPSKSLVMNIGFDNSGTHCDATAQFDQNVFQERILIEQIAVEENKFAKKDVKDFFTKKKRRKFFKQLIARQAFDPSLLGAAINPFYFARKGLAKNIRDFARKITGDVLDVECGDKPYENFFNFNRYIGLEYGLPTNQGHKKADFLYDRKKIPFADAQFDSLICRGVLENVDEAKDFLQEVRRVLKAGAYGIVVAPFTRIDSDADYGQYTAFGLQEILEGNGFEVLEFRKSGDNISTKFQLINFYIYKKIARKGCANFIEKSLLALLTFFFNLMGLALCLAVPKNNNLYLDNIVLVRKK